MTTDFSIQSNFPLRNHNTFGIEAKAQAYVCVKSVDVLPLINKSTALQGLPRLILGGGSNILLIDDFRGVVVHMCNAGIAIIREDADASYVRAAAGENWHAFVQWTLAHGLGGLENLSLIPGSVGAAPIQNIGAYGVEAQDTFHELTAFNFETNELFVLDKADCEFGYRDSVFKHRLKDCAVILDVTFRLPKRWQPNVRYADVAQELAHSNITEPTARQISDAVIAIRTRKLPDPAMIGNAGSFFKNPIVQAAQRDALLQQYPQLVSYAQPDGTYKLAAGWLIDQCGWKGKTVGRAGVYEKQALVLVNRGGATGRDVTQLAEAIQADVAARFNVKLEPEPVYV